MYRDRGDMAEKSRRNSCLKLKAFNFLMGFTLLVSLMVLAASMYRIDSYPSSIKFSVCANKIIKGEVDIAGTRDTGSFECNDSNQADINGKEDTNLRHLLKNIEYEKTDVPSTSESSTTKSHNMMITTTDETPPEEREEKEFFEAQFNMKQPPAEFNMKQTPVEFETKQSPAKFDMKQTPVDFNMKQTPVEFDMKQTPVEFDKKHSSAKFDMKQPADVAEFDMKQPADLAEFDKEKSPIESDMEQPVADFDMKQPADLDEFDKEKSPIESDMEQPVADFDMKQPPINSDKKQTPAKIDIEQPVAEFDMKKPSKSADHFSEQLQEQEKTTTDSKSSSELEIEQNNFEKYVNDSVDRETQQEAEHRNDPKKRGKKLKHFAFLKVHKAGSTTMQNIFFRFGLRNNLTFVLPKKGHYLFKAKNVIPVKPGHKYDILANHIVNFRGHFFKRFLPKDSVNVAIVREPLDRMISAAFYYREVWNKKYLVNIPKERFIQNLIRKTEKYEPVSLSRTKNSMGLDFGFPKTITVNDKEEIKARMNRLVKRFSLVLVMEKFDESLILLKRMMNWDISDIMYIPTNSHSHSSTDLARRDYLKFKEINFLDYIIYETFTEILDAKIKASGQSFQDEVEHFKQVLQQAKRFCEDETRSVHTLEIPESSWNKAFSFPYTECVYINMEELDFVAKLKARHLKMHNLSHKVLK